MAHGLETWLRKASPAARDTQGRRDLGLEGSGPSSIWDPFWTKIRSGFGLKFDPDFGANLNPFPDLELVHF